MTTVIPFRKRADLDDVALDIFVALACAKGVDISITCRQFFDEHAHLRPADLAAAFALSHKVIAVFERHLAKVDDENSDGGAA